MRTGILIPLLSILAWAMAGSRAQAESPESVRFGRDILPILSENCFKCHGPDEKARRAKLRLDLRESAMKVIEPGKSDESEIIRRVFSSDPDGGTWPFKSNFSPCRFYMGRGKLQPIQTGTADGPLTRAYSVKISEGKYDMWDAQLDDIGELAQRATTEFAERQKTAQEQHKLGLLAPEVEKLVKAAFTPA